MSNQPNTNDYTTDKNIVDSGRQSSQVTINDFNRLTRAIEHESNKQKALVLCALLPHLPKEKQSYHAIARLFREKGIRVSHVTIMRWVNLAGKEIFRNSVQKGGESNNVIN